MRAVVVGDDRAPALATVPAPRPRAGEVLVGVRAVALCGSDVEKLAGGSAVPGAVLGHEVSGIVLDGALPAGTRVTVAHHVGCGACARCLSGHETTCLAFAASGLRPGGFAERLVASEAHVASTVLPLPDEVADDGRRPRGAAGLRGARPRRRCPPGAAQVARLRAPWACCSARPPAGAPPGRRGARSGRRRACCAALEDADSVRPLPTTSSTSAWSRTRRGLDDALRLLRPGGTMPALRRPRQRRAPSTSTASTAHGFVLRGGAVGRRRTPLREALELIRSGAVRRPSDLVDRRAAAGALRRGARALPLRPGAEGGVPALRAAIFHAPGDVRVEERPEPAPGPGQLVIRVEAALTCGTDAKTYRRGHPVLLGPPPARSGTSTRAPCCAPARARRSGPASASRGANSAPCGACRTCRRGARAAVREPLPAAQRGVRGGAARARAVRRRQRPPHRRRRRQRGGRDVRAAGLRPPRRRGQRGRRRRPHRRSSAAGPLGRMLAAALAARGCDVVSLGRLDPDPEERFDRVIEAAGTVEAWDRAVRLTAPGGTVVLFGGTPRGTTLEVDTFRLHYEALTMRGVFHHAPAPHPRRARGARPRRPPPTGRCSPTDFGLEDVVAPAGDDGRARAPRRPPQGRRRHDRLGPAGSYEPSAASGSCAASHARALREVLEAGLLVLARGVEDDVVVEAGLLARSRPAPPRTPPCRVRASSRRGGTASPRRSGAGSSGRRRGSRP